MLVPRAQRIRHYEHSVLNPFSVSGSFPVSPIEATSLIDKLKVISLGIESGFLSWHPAFTSSIWDVRARNTRLEKATGLELVVRSSCTSATGQGQSDADIAHHWKVSATFCAAGRC
jgi:hypothetical protein